jgi:hypothetical protein
MVVMMKMTSDVRRGLNVDLASDCLSWPSDDDSANVVIVLFVEIMTDAFYSSCMRGCPSLVEACVLVVRWQIGWHGDCGGGGDNDRRYSSACCVAVLVLDAHTMWSGYARYLR